ncbi:MULTISPECIES: hypothetical protein [unclassified Cellulophaga]|uniref:hypothetical protein n=1 Tax=unclassified Cellulophaga TaxID=2634405 RepID=UPI0026E2237F|nr:MULTISPECIES: hypothetical protein [unclassified Cellulophaga]MDO6491871.1 hypothetical protein [Cellulophaga sp. 2_MG-2023]MDO6495474.1 hypothetical protein [Cellulophaga sp. 3_MG-2023]
MNFYDVEGKIITKPALDFGALFNKGIELFKVVWLPGFVTVLFSTLLTLLLVLVMYTPLIALGIFNAEAFESQEPPIAYTFLSMFLMPVIVVCIFAVNLLLMAGFYRICRAKDAKLNTDGHFYYFKKQYISKAFVLALITIGLAIVGMLACGVGLIYLGVPLALFPVFLAFEEELSALEIVKASFALGNKNWLVLFGVTFVMGLIAQLGVILCVVGILFTAMLARIPIYYAYKDGVGFKDDDTEDRLKALASSDL